MEGERREEGVEVERRAGGGRGGRVKVEGRG